MTNQIKKWNPDASNKRRVLTRIPSKEVENDPPNSYFNKYLILGTFGKLSIKRKKLFNDLFSYDFSGTVEDYARLSFVSRRIGGSEDSCLTAGIIFQKRSSGRNQREPVGHERKSSVNAGWSLDTEPARLTRNCAHYRRIWFERCTIFPGYVCVHVMLVRV